MQTAFNSGIDKVTGLARTWLVTTTGMLKVSAMRFSAAACWPAGRARQLQESASGRSISAKSKVCISACMQWSRGYHIAFSWNQPA